MRNSFLSLLVFVCGLVTESASFAQGYASEDSVRIKEALERYQAVFGPPTSSEGPALAALCMSLGDAPLRAECIDKARVVTRLYKNAVILLKDQPEKIDALPDVYSGQYKRGRMSDMSVTDQIGMASFQYSYVAFLMWYVQCYPLPHISKVPLEVPPSGSSSARPRS
jgi:hypothetical protein